MSSSDDITFHSKSNPVYRLEDKSLHNTCVPQIGDVFVKYAKYHTFNISFMESVVVFVCARAHAATYCLVEVTL